MNKKTLTVLLMGLLVVLVLFVVSLLLGSRKPGSGLKLDLESPGTARIASWLGRPAKAKFLTLRSGSPKDCLLEGNQITIKAGATCVYVVATDKFWTRKLRLRQPASQDGSGQINVLLVQQEALDVRQTPEPGKTSDPLDIYGRQDQAPATLKIETRGIPGLDPQVYIIEIVEK